MTPKEKAEELVDKFENYSFMDIDKRISSFNSAKQCALIAVDEICEILEDNGLTFIDYHDRTTIEYWLQVKQEIENL
jgi:hypothetical protein